MPSMGLRLQNFKPGQQVVVLARLAEGRSGAPWCTPTELARLYEELGVPGPAKISNVLASLADKGEVTRKLGARGQWRLTPAGKAKSVELMGDLDLIALQTEAQAQGAPDLGHVLHSLIPTSFAPPALIEPLRGFLEKFPFETNVFGMTRFPDEQDKTDPDPVGPALDVTRTACDQHGLSFHVASDRAIVDDLWMNVAGHMWASRFGIAFFEDRKGKGINYNLTIEVGAMLTLGRRSALLKDASIKTKLPTDLVGQIYTPVDLDDPAGLSVAVHRWLRDDLALGPCGNCGDA